MNPRICDEIRPLLPAHLDGDLDPAETARVRDHLEGCPSCRAHLGTIRRAVDALHRLPDLPPPASILAGVRERLRPVPWHRRILARRPWLTGVPIGALATVLVVIGVALFQARYPRLSQVAEERTAVPPPATRDTRQAVPKQQQVPRPQPPPESGASKPAPKAPAPAARKTPAPAVVTARKPAPPSEREVVVVQPEPFTAAPATPSSPATQAVPAPMETPSPLGIRPQAAAPPPTRFVIPAPARRSLTEVSPSSGGNVASGFRGAGAPAGGDLPAPSGMVPLRAAPSPLASPPRLLEAGSPRPAPEPVRQTPAPVPETLEALTVLLPEGEDLEELRQLVRREGGRILETRVLEPRARREAFEPHRAQAGLRGEVSQGWRLTVRMPRRGLAGFATALEQRPGRLVLDRRTVPLSTRGRPAEAQTLRITVLR